MNERQAPENIHNAPTIGDNSPQANASVQDRAGLYIAIVALILATLAIGLVIMMPVIIEAKVQAGISDARADIQQQIASIEATAKVGAQHSRIALSEVERANAELAAKGLIKLASH